MIGFRFVDGRTPPVAQAQGHNAIPPDETCVMQLASLWSIDPTTLDRHFKEPVTGLLGNVSWAEGRTGQ